LNYIETLHIVILKEFLQKYYSYGCIKSNDKAPVNNGCTRQCNCKLPEDIVTWSNENPLLRLDIRGRVWMEN